MTTASAAAQDHHRRRRKRRHDRELRIDSSLRNANISTSCCRTARSPTNPAAASSASSTWKRPSSPTSAAHNPYNSPWSARGWGARGPRAPLASCAGRRAQGVPAAKPRPLGRPGAKPPFRPRPSSRPPSRDPLPSPRAPAWRRAQQAPARPAGATPRGRRATVNTPPCRRMSAMSPAATHVRRMSPVRAHCPPNVWPMPPSPAAMSKSQTTIPSPGRAREACLHSPSFPPPSRDGAGRREAGP